MGLITTEEVARRLGVRKATIYAYVSRGLLTSHRHADGKESVFDEADVAAFAAARRRPGTSPADGPAVHTGITLITGDDLFYRGHRALDLAVTASFEAVVSLLWTGRMERDALAPEPGVCELAAATIAPLPARARIADRLRIVVAAAATADPLRSDLTPAAVVAAGRALLATMVAALPARSAFDCTQLSCAQLNCAQLSGAQYNGGPTNAPQHGGLAATLWTRLTPQKPSAAGVAALNAALILLADHDLAASTYAARVAASTRADPYAVVGAGLAALDGPLHGSASMPVFDLLTEAGKDVAGAVAARLRRDGGLPGFGHPLYPGGDPRATALLAMLPPDETVAAVRETAARRSGATPNVDFALGALMKAHGMGSDGGEAIFAVGRTAGWIAHALEEYADQPSRFRPSGRYAGRPPA